MNPSSAFVGKPSRRRELLGQREKCPVSEVVAVHEEELGIAGGRVVELQLRAGQGLRHRPPTLSSGADASAPNSSTFRDEHLAAAAAVLADGTRAHRAAERCSRRLATFAAQLEVSASHETAARASSHSRRTKWPLLDRPAARGRIWGAASGLRGLRTRASAEPIRDLYAVAGGAAGSTARRHSSPRPDAGLVDAWSRLRSIGVQFT